MLHRKVQLTITNRFASSTTKQYSNLMIRLGNELLTKSEKELFNEIVLGQKIKEKQDDYFWYKGDSTPFVITSAIYKDSKNEIISVSLFIKDDQGMDLIWISNTFNDFIQSIVTDMEFRKMVKTFLQ